MGFDLYGISPKQNEIKPEILSKFQTKMDLFNGIKCHRTIGIYILK